MYTYFICAHIVYIKINKYIYFYTYINKYRVSLKNIPFYHKLVVFWKFKIFLKWKVFTWDATVRRVKAFVKGKHTIVIKAQNS